MSELKSRLPKADADLAAFLAGADKTVETTTATADSVYPWQENHIRGDVIKVYNLRLAEAYLLKLKYIAQHTPDSMQKFCLNVLEKAIDDKIDEITKF
jgi:hypothetical protein